MKERIGIFSDDFYPIKGGQGRHLYDLYKSIYCKGKFLVFSPNNNNLRNHIHIKIKNVPGRNLIFSCLLNIKINQIIERYNLKTVHFHCGPGGLLILKKPTAKMICTVHHTYYQQQQNIPIQKWKYLLYLLEKKMYQNADKIIAVSEDTKEVLVKRYGLSPSKIKVVLNSVDKGVFKRMQYVKKIPLSLLFVGRLDTRKGIDLLIESMPLIKDKIPDVQLIVIGKGKLKDRLNRYVIKNKLQNNVRFLGFVPDKKLPYWYNRCQLTVVPSIFEGFGIVILESISCGTSVIGANVDGIKSLLTRNHLFNREKEDLTKKIIFHLHNPSRNKISTFSSNSNDTRRILGEMYG